MVRKFFTFVLIGAVVASAAYAQSSETDQDTAKGFFSTLFVADGGYLGVETTDINKDNFGKYNLSVVRGVAVEKVLDGSPAQTAGLQSGDVIVKFNGEDVTSVKKLSRLVSEVAPDHQVKLTVARGGSEQEITATIGKRPAPEAAQGSFRTMAPGAGRLSIPPMDGLRELRIAPPGAPIERFLFRSGPTRQIGIGITPLTKQLAAHYGVQGGVLITNVIEDSPASKAGLKAGDIVVEADGKELGADQDLIRAIADKKEGALSLTIVREGRRQTLSVTPEEMKGSFNQVFEFPEGKIPDSLFKNNVPGSPAAPAVPLSRFLFNRNVL